MAREVINVGAAPNDGTGDPIRTAYQKCNNNFAELYSLSTAPTAIVNGNTAVRTFNNSNVTVSVAGFANVATFTTNGITVANISTPGSINASGTITGSFFLGNGSQLTGMYGNANVENYLSSFAGPIEANTITANSVSASSVTGDLFGSVYADDSSIIIDSLNNTVTANTATFNSITVNGLGEFQGVQVTGNVDVTGNVNVTGNLNYIDVTDFVLGDPLFYIGANNTSNIVDLGIVTQWNDGTQQYGGWVRDATDGVWKLFGNVIAAPTTTVNFTNAIYQPLQIGSLTATTGTFSGNVSAPYFVGNGSQLTGIVSSYGNANVALYLDSYLPSYVGNIAAGNIAVTGNVSTLNILTDGYYYANGQPLDFSSSYGNANVAAYLPTYTGNVSAGNVNVSGNVATLNILTDGYYYANGQPLDFSSSYGNANVADYLPIYTGNVSAGNINVSGNVTASYFIGNGSLLTGIVTTYGDSNVAAYLPTYTGNISAGNVIVTNDVSVASISKTGANGAGNIGSSTNYFNTVFAQATSAQYADLAEYYLSDQAYEPGTVLKFGGVAEVTQADVDSDPTIVGVVSTNPAYIMNAKLVGQHSIAVALMGRVPCKVKGPVRRGQMLVSAGDGHARAENSPATGTVIGKAVHDFADEVGIVEVVVGRL